VNLDWIAGGGGRAGEELLEQGKAMKCTAGLMMATRNGRQHPEAIEIGERTPIDWDRERDLGTAEVAMDREEKDIAPRVVWGLLRVP
jgi:hypothetical protein